MFTHPTSPDSTTHGVTSEPLDDVLSDPHCKHLLRFLQRTEGAVPVRTVSRYIVSQVTGTAATEVSRNVQRRVQTWLHHGQLPALALHGIVNFDPEQGTVELTADTDVAFLLSADGPSTENASPE